MIKQLRALARYLTHWVEQGRPSLLWLCRSSRRMNAAFVLRHKRELADVSRDDEFQYVTIEGKIFVWPGRSSIEALAEFLSELLQKQHPHHYDASLTPIEATDTVLDVGACEGAFSAFAAEKGAKVISIEPSRFMSRVIKRLFELRGLPPSQIVNCLLGESERELPFKDDHDKPGSSGPVEEASEFSYPVPMLTLDDFVGQYLPGGLTYIKCDAEGWDSYILRSGREAIIRYKPKIAITTYHNSEDYRIIAGFLSPLGYTCRGKGLLYFPHQGEYRTLMLHASHRSRI